MAQQTVTIEAIRNFYHGMKLVKVGQTIDVSMALAKELIGWNKAKMAEAKGKKE